MIINLNAVNGKYDIIIEPGSIYRAGEYFNLKRKVLIVSDTGVPCQYIDAVKNQCQSPVVFIFKKGEKNKNINTYKKVMECLLNNGFTRGDAIVAVGGGVVGDLSGFCASTYMRGIDFYNIPTTLLAQVDSSIGGKTAIDFCGVKNIIGGFYQPIGVLIDTNTLKTLSKRQFKAGLVEAIKMATTSDHLLFEFIENSNNIFEDIDTVIYKSLLIKKDIVEKDTLERGLRKILNFGHTVGHAIESSNNMRLLHGECVAIGIMYFVSKKAKIRLEALLKKCGLSTYSPICPQQIVEFIRHDKKANGDMIDIICVEEIGQCKIERIKIDHIINYLQ